MLTSNNLFIKVGEEGRKCLVNEHMHVTSKKIRKAATVLIYINGSEVVGNIMHGFLPQLSIQQLLCPQLEPALGSLVGRVAQTFISEGPESSIVLLYFFFIVLVFYLYHWS